MRLSAIPALVLMLGAAMPALAQPAAMTEQQFLDGWTSAQGQKDAPDKAAAVTRLMQDVVPMLTRYKQILADDAAAGKSPRACPPPGAKISLNFAEIARDIAQEPPARRTAPIADLLYARIDAQFPCRSI